MTLREELSAMLDKARRYLRSAEVLRLEADYDSAISRLYYAMFYCAEAVLFAKGHSFSSHHAVISAFGQHLVKTGLLPAEMHQWLREGFEQRQISDYDFVSSAEEAQVAELKARAEQFLSKIEGFLKQEGHV
ncbi:MAG: HEPN domain-containing protein [Anaerolineales bacterium]